MKLKLTTNFFCFFSLLLLFCTTASFSDEGIVVNSAFFKKFNRTHPLHRDKFLENSLTGVIIGQGLVTGVEERNVFKKKYQITMEQKGLGKIKFIYHIFLSNTVELLKKGDLFEFKGQCVGITPIDTMRRIYIIDIIFKEGSTIIK